MAPATPTPAAPSPKNARNNVCLSLCDLCSPLIARQAPPACRVYMLPPCACTFVGLAYVGCDDTGCRSWVSGEFWHIPQAYAHELGHNLWLSHAGATQTDGSFDM